VVWIRLRFRVGCRGSPEPCSAASGFFTQLQPSFHTNLLRYFAFNPLPFERMEVYRAARIRDRLTPDLLQEYGAGIGSEPLRSAFQLFTEFQLLRLCAIASLR